ncbi:asparaginyl-tRNA synthetase [Anseongella ginsenosidimutans]|uniref:Asparagine--tRNA ligase n=1 Tax=Anseongella ginsenosidimutans TaxID=496056 RepID=A0A4R3KR73_9SPHI|nr:asparagine--tRNA ligase [Anseongella ginsenosidimutans]QEC53672.1 asparagine--tRNA ligase [Anseongella ginsenosidimutans]TCS86078.1 asparaginyl-tRNA synthetase [Anseongella ginsenosidimutans]
MAFIEQLAAVEGQTVTLRGWVANKRSSKGLVFIILRDGTGLCQCVADASKLNEEAFSLADKLTQESSVEITGKICRDERQVGGYELRVSDLKVYQLAQDYPITKKAHGVEFLMDNRHLWLRSNRQWAIMRIRNRIIQAIHRFFQERGFIEMDSPIFTGNAAEGTTTLFETDFYDEKAYLAQTGQLYGEAMAMAMGRIYTFGPTFRAEKSKTRRHLSEFWMIEPEIAFCDLDMNMDLIEEFLRYVVEAILEECPEELELLERNIEKLKNVRKPFPRMSYTDAVKIIRGEKDVNGRNSIKTLENDLAELRQRITDIQAEVAEREAKIKAPGMKKGEINFNQNKIAGLKNELKDLEESSKNIPQWIESAKAFEHGNDFGGSDETVLTRLFDSPVMVYNWPAGIKAFYMKRANDPDYVKGVDVLAPEGYGEIVGGSEREDNLDLLVERIKDEGLPMEAFEWYLDLRRYGSVPHSGFGLGLERLVAWICKLPHVRETIPFPRMYGRLFP